MSIIHFLTDFRGWSEKLQLTACCLFLNLESLEETVTAGIKLSSDVQFVGSLVNLIRLRIFFPKDTREGGK